MAGSWFQHAQTHHWTTFSNAGDAAKEIAHVLIDGHWRMIPNCRVDGSAQFFTTDHRRVVETLKLQLKSEIMVPSHPRLDVCKLKDERVAEEFVKSLSGDFGVLGDLGNPEELWSAFKTTILNVRSRCLRTHQGAKKNFVSQETLDTIGQSRRARFNGRAELFKELRSKALRVLRVSKEVYA